MGPELVGVTHGLFLLCSPTPTTPYRCGVFLCLPSCPDPTPFLPHPKSRDLCTALESWEKAATGGGKGKTEGTSCDLCLPSPLTCSAAFQRVEFSTSWPPTHTQFPLKPPPFPSLCLPASYPSFYSILKGGDPTSERKEMGIWHGVSRGLWRLETQDTPVVASEMEGEDMVCTQPSVPHAHLVPGSAWACLASLHTSHSTAKPAQLGD